MNAETPLHGGTANRGLVVRVGDTVRRPQRATAAGAHALLDHLRDVGFDGAPRFLGVDDQGREVMSYITGEAITPPYPAWALTEETLSSVAGLLSRYHEAVEDFDPSPYVWPESPPTPYGGGLVSHNDTNLDNVVFRGRRAVALIDFDLASPGSRLWDVATTARLWSPLRHDDDVTDPRRGQTLRRFRFLVDAYGVPAADRPALVDAVRRNHDWLYTIVRVGAEQGNPGFADNWDQAAPRVARTREWLAANEQRLVDVLVATEEIQPATWPQRAS
jgi:hypothetical protein